jgi:hypothetical protein
MIDSTIAVVIVAVIAVAGVVAAGYTHARLRYHSATRRQEWLTRVVLIVTGIAFGVTMAIIYSFRFGIWPPLTFVAAFGLVHVPAAFILFIKRHRGEYR